MSPFPHRDILPAPQQLLWPDLAAIPAHFVLYGGTAVALHLGHRISVDFDFFATPGFEPPALLDSLPFLQDAEILQSTANTLTVLVARDGTVKLSFFGGLGFGRVGEPRATPDGVLRVASPLDLLATKLKTLLSRAAARDYADLAALLRSGLTLQEGLAAAVALYGASFPIAAAVRGLCYFDDLGEELARNDQQMLMDAVRALPLDLPEIHLASPNLAP
ncbi:MAG: nucleotidyl transferase AbiEii/AbiGii toxin family protein [Thermodesulfobacteriota bacterium]